MDKTCEHIIVTRHTDRRRTRQTSHESFRQCQRPATTGSEECKQHAAECGLHRATFRPRSV